MEQRPKHYTTIERALVMVTDREAGYRYLVRCDSCGPVGHQHLDVQQADTVARRHWRRVYPTIRQTR